MQPHIRTLNLLRLSSGDDLALQFYRFCGNNPQTKTYIQANLHGAEIVGNLVIQELLAWLSSLDEEQLTGEICLLPGCNPLGMNQRSHFFSPGRYNPYDGKDWNRIFYDYGLSEKEVYTFAKKYLDATLETIYQAYLDRLREAWQIHQDFNHNPSGVPFSVHYQQTLQSLCLDANYVIDIHSSSNRGIDYLFTFPGQEEITKAFLLEFAILVDRPEGYTFDEAFIKPWLSLQNTFAQLERKLNFGLESWTLELGSGMTADGESVVKGVTGIQNYLITKGVVKLDRFPPSNQGDLSLEIVQKNQIKKYYAPTGGIIKSHPQLKCKVKAGEIIYQILELNKQGEPPQMIAVTAEKSGMIFDVGTNQSVNQGEYVLTIIEQKEKND